MLPYAVRQVLWLLGITLRLLLAFSAGVKWFVQMIRLYVYGTCLCVFVLRPLLWYLTSPTVIRHVAYRSSEATRRRNVLRILEEEGLDWGAAGGGGRGGDDGKDDRDRRAVRRLVGGGVSINPADGTALQGLPLSAESRQAKPRPRRTPRQRSLSGGKAPDGPERHSSSSSCGPSARQSADSAGAGAHPHHPPLHRPHARRPPPPPPRRSVRPLPPSHMRPRAAGRSAADGDAEDRMNLHNRAFLDIFLPLPLDSLMNTLEFAKQNTKLRRKKFPIVILLCGGIWIIGSNLWGAILARSLAARGYVVFSPDYRNFPQTTMEGMILDVSDAIGWVLSNAERYNGDLDNVTVIGHDAGAHLTLMSLLSQAHLRAYDEEARQQREGGGGGGSLDRLPAPPSAVAYNVPRFDPRRSIHKYIGLSGMYNVEALAGHFARKGLHRSVLAQIAGGADRLARYSVPAYFDGSRVGATGEVLPDTIFDFLPAKMFFLHGDADGSAPVMESAALVGQLRQAQQERALRQLQRQREVLRHALQREALLRGDSREELPDTDGEAASPAARRAPTASAAGAGAAPVIAVPAPPRAPVELEFVAVSGARHADMTIEECLVAGRSSCVEFLCDYESAGDLHSLSTPVDARGEPFPGQPWRPPSGPAAACDAAGAVYPAAAPGAVLPLAVPVRDRPLLMRLAAYINPF